MDITLPEPIRQGSPVGTKPSEYKNLYSSSGYSMEYLPNMESRESRDYVVAGSSSFSSIYKPKFHLEDKWGYGSFDNCDCHDVNCSKPHTPHRNGAKINPFTSHMNSIAEVDSYDRECSGFRPKRLDPTKPPLDERLWVDFIASENVWRFSGMPTGSLLRMPRLPSWKEVQNGFMSVDFPRTVAEKNFYLVDYNGGNFSHKLPLHPVPPRDEVGNMKITLHLEPQEDMPTNIADRVVRLCDYAPLKNPDLYRQNEASPPLQGVHYYLQQTFHYTDANDLTEFRLGFRIGEPIFPLPKPLCIKANPAFEKDRCARLIFNQPPSSKYYPMLYHKNKKKKRCRIKIIFGEPPLPDNGLCSPWYPFNFNKADCMNGDPFSRRGLVLPTAMKCPFRRNKRAGMQTMRMTETGIFPEEIFCEFGMYNLNVEECVYYRCDQDMGNRKFEVPDVLKAHEINFDHFEESLEFEPYFGRWELRRFRRVSRYPWKAVLKNSYDEVMEQRRKYVEQNSREQLIDCTKLTIVNGIIYWYYEPYESFDHSGPNQRSGGDHELAYILFKEQEKAFKTYKMWRTEVEQKMPDGSKYKLQIADELNIEPFGENSNHLNAFRGYPSLARKDVDPSVVSFNCNPMLGNPMLLKKEVDPHRGLVSRSKARMSKEQSQRKKKKKDNDPYRGLDSGPVARLPKEWDFERNQYKNKISTKAI